MQNTKNNKQKSQRKARNLRTEIPSTQMEYRGPIQDPMATKEEDLHTMVIGYTSTLTSSAGGVIAAYLINNISSSPEWASLAALFSEYRVLGCEIEYFPVNRYSKTTTSTAPGILAVRHDGATLAPGSYDGLMNFSSARKVSIEDPWSHSAHMTGTEEAQFLITSDTAPRFGFLLYADGLSASQTYGRYFFYWRVQFRGRR